MRRMHPHETVYRLLIEDKSDIVLCFLFLCQFVAYVCVLFFSTRFAMFSFYSNAKKERRIIVNAISVPVMFTAKIQWCVNDIE